ncbi:hypothetical protein [Marinifilum caeruleilacunae]|uniref:DUF4064 domain-containing protein n=1 Tax=Marinifilum caeruleilacunae TaxID=2499076 RepID=A0ABX1WRH5_9BACT|nr:hypothetical protein [Marinifilum caeruleilacunae]NOU58565.1 hypothetical protein [Marinifilum caeruleilacunae]
MIRIIIGGAVASAILTSLLYGFVFTNYLAEELAIPWTSFRHQILMIDWTCLFLGSFATALLLGFGVNQLSAGKGVLLGGTTGLFLVLIGMLTGVQFIGTGYYLLCYLIWGWILGTIIHKRKQLIIRQF